MCLQLIQVRILRQILRKMPVRTECIQIGKYGIAFELSRIFDPDMIRVREHGHDLLLHIRLALREIDAVAERLAHFGLSVGTWKS